MNEKVVSLMVLKYWAETLIGPVMGTIFSGHKKVCSPRHKMDINAGFGIPAQCRWGCEILVFGKGGSYQLSSSRKKFKSLPVFLTTKRRLVVVLEQFATMGKWRPRCKRSRPIIY